MTLASSTWHAGTDYSALALSIQVSLAATVVALPPGVALGIWLARTRSRLRGAVEVLTLAPLVVPPVVTGFLLLLVLRAVGGGLLFTWWAAAAAAAIVSLPLLIRTVRTTVEHLDSRLWIAAATLGASRARILWTVTIPLAWRGIVAGATLAWARALGEFGATIVVAGNIPGRTRTIPLAIWTSVQSRPLHSAVPLVIAAIVLSIAAIALSEALIRRPRLKGRHARTEAQEAL